MSAAVRLSPVPPCFEGDEKDGDVVVLELVDEPAAVLGGAGEFEVGGLAGDEFVLDELQQSLLLENLFGDYEDEELFYFGRGTLLFRDRNVPAPF